MSAKGLIIQNRDLEIIKYVGSFPLADISAIHQQCFQQTSVTAAARRVKMLFDNGLLSRISSFCDGAFRYYVTNKNNRLAGLQERKVKRVQKSQLHHDIELYSFLRDLRGKLKDTDRIIPDFELSQYAKRNYRHSFSYKGVVQAGEMRFLPDALVKLDPVNVFLEWDRDTVHGINLHRKVLAYGMFFQELKATRANFDIHKFRVVFVCPSEKRCHAIAEQFEQVTGISGITRTIIQSEALDFFDQKSVY